MDPLFVSKYLEKTVVLEGNIGAGKSSVIAELQRKHPEYTYMCEPLNEFCSFRKCDGTTLNPLEIFYSHPNNAIVTQLYFLDIYEKRVKQMENAEDLHPIVICDRWITSCKIFTDALAKCSFISPFASEYFNQKYMHLENTLTYAIPSAIYLIDTPVDICIQRQKQRGRMMEVEFPHMLEYMKQLDTCFKQVSNTFANKCYVQKSIGTTIEQRVEEIETLIAKM